jgi:hypothetical protein
MNRFRKLGFIAYNGGIEHGIEVHSSSLMSSCTTSRKSRVKLAAFSIRDRGGRCHYRHRLLDAVVALYLLLSRRDPRLKPDTARALSRNRFESHSPDSLHNKKPPTWKGPSIRSETEAPKRKSPSRRGGLLAGASDLRDKYASRDRRYNDRSANLVPSIA